MSRRGEGRGEGGGGATKREGEGEVQASSCGVSHGAEGRKIGNIVGGTVAPLQGDRWELPQW